MTCQSVVIAFYNFRSRCQNIEQMLDTIKNNYFHNIQLQNDKLCDTTFPGSPKNIESDSENYEECEDDADFEGYKEIDDTTESADEKECTDKKECIDKKQCIDEVRCIDEKQCIDDKEYVAGKECVYDKGRLVNIGSAADRGRTSGIEYVLIFKCENSDKYTNNNYSNNALCIVMIVLYEYLG